MSPIAQIDRKLRAGSYAPALAGVVASLRAGRHPSPLELGTMLFEAGCDREEARALVGQYRDAIAGSSSGEDTLMTQLRAFSLPRQ